MWIGHCKEIQISLRWPIHIINSFDYKTIFGVSTIQLNTLKIEILLCLGFLPFSGMISFILIVSLSS